MLVNSEKIITKVHCSIFSKLKYYQSIQLVADRETSVISSQYQGPGGGGPGGGGGVVGGPGGGGGGAGGGGGGGGMVDGDVGLEMKRSPATAPTTPSQPDFFPQENVSER